MIRKKPRLRRSTDRATWLRGGREIAAAIGVDRNQLAELVDKHRLPAFKYLGRWTLITADLPEWMAYIRGTHDPRLKRRPAPRVAKRPRPPK